MFLQICQHMTHNQVELADDMHDDMHHQEKTLMETDMPADDTEHQQ